ncbi:MAG: cache domain-containing protein, partial [Desulfobacteraceae bacterium]
MLFITVISFVCLYFLWVLNEYTEFKQESVSITENFADSEKKKLKTQVQSVLEYVQHMRGQTEKRVRNSIKRRVNEAYAIAVNIYNENKDSKPGDEIKKMITDALRPIRFNQDRGYYFAFTMEGIETLFADRPEMEGKNMLSVQGARGEFVVRDMIQLIRTKDEGFYSYTWSKPGEKDPEHLKIAYVKSFEPYDWAIGTGEYVKDVEKEIQEEVLERISKLRFDKEGYFFGSIVGGLPLFTNGKITKGTENIWNLTDPKGVKIIQEQNRAAKNPEGGFVSYSWPKLDSGKLSPKLSYVAGIPEWEWIIGAGVYMDTMDEIIHSKKQDLYHDFLKQAALYFVFMIFMSLLVFLWINYQVHKIQSGIRLFTNFFETASFQAAAIDSTELQFEEFKRIAMAANQMIEARTKAVQTLQESEKKYRLIAENMSDVISLIDMDLRFTYVSPSISGLTGFSVDEALKLSIEEIMTPDSYKEIFTIIEEEITVEASGKKDPHRSRIIEYKQYKKDRSIIWVESNCKFLRDMDQKPVGILIITRDITERKVAGEEKEQLQAQLIQAQKLESVGRLAGGVAHDFNNMLGVILGHAELALLKADEDNDLISDLKEIQTAAKRSANLTKQLLTFARKDIISPKQLDLNDTVESMLNMLRRLIGEDIDLVWKPSAHLWPVKMDPSQIDQILANLCINAKDAIAGVGKLTIETGRKSFDEAYCNERPGFIPGDFLLLAVSDNGCGMDKEILDNLFEPFFTTKAVGKGTGLGLATVYGIVKQNNGFINVTSEPGQGSTFNIYLPRLVAVEDTDKAVPEKKPAAGGSETILLVEDEPTILKITRMMLERKGYTVLSAATPTEAVAKAKEHAGSIDLLMTDVVMPEMNGRDLAEKIISLYPEITLLFMS